MRAIDCHCPVKDRDQEDNIKRVDDFFNNAAYEQSCFSIIEFV